MPGKASGQIIGYKYYLGMHMVICRAVDAVLQIQVGNRVMWDPKAATQFFTAPPEHPNAVRNAFYNETRDDGTFQVGDVIVATWLDQYSNIQQFAGGQSIDCSTNNTALFSATFDLSAFGRGSAVAAYISQGVWWKVFTVASVPSSPPVVTVRLHNSAIPNNDIIHKLRNPQSTYQVNGITRMETQDLNITAEGLFGGDQREGGVSGKLGILMGGPEQVADPYLSKMFGPFTPAFRGVLSLVLKQMYIGVNPYLKNWAALVVRAPFSPVSESNAIMWLPELASIIAPDGYVDINPAHLLRELVWNPDFGMGYPTTQVDDTSLAVAAQQLYDERFGISLMWEQQSSTEAFMQYILNHINGIWKVNPATGKFQLTLIRKDYVFADLKILDESNCTLDDYQSVSWGETVNEIVLRYAQRVTGSSTSVTVQDLANIQIQQQVVSHTIELKGINSDELAFRVAQSHLQVMSTPLNRVEITVNRQGWSLAEGDVFRFSWPKKGILDVVYRIGEISSGLIDDGKIKIKAVIDVFGLNASTFISAEPIGWADPAIEAVPAPAAALFEANYWDLVFSEGVNVASSQEDGAAFIFGAALRPVGMGYFQLWSGSGTEPTQLNSVSTGNFCPSCTVVGPLVAEVQSTITYTDEHDFGLLSPGVYGYIEDELVGIVEGNSEAKTMVILRGLNDTVPTSHPDGALFFAYRGFNAPDKTEYAEGDTVYGKVTPVGPLGPYPLALADTLSLVLKGRVNMPYPPGNVKVNNMRYPANVSRLGNVALSFSHRNRLSQTVDLVAQTVANIAPEEDVYYVVEVFYGDWDTKVRTITLTEEHFLADHNIVLYTQTMQQADLSPLIPGYVQAMALPAAMGFTIETARPASEEGRPPVTSWQKHKVAFTRT